MMNPVISFLASTNGRIIRVAAGAALVLWGTMGLSGTAAVVVTVIGLVPLLAGLFDRCVFAPLFGAPFSGPKIRAAK
jgi:hypothetical protein